MDKSYIEQKYQYNTLHLLQLLQFEGTSTVWFLNFFYLFLAYKYYSFCFFITVFFRGSDYGS